jgi:hypothetical protein
MNEFVKTVMRIVLGNLVSLGSDGERIEQYLHYDKVGYDHEDYEEYSA